MPSLVRALFASAFVVYATAATADDTFARDPTQPTDRAYTAKIREYTTDPSFNSPLTDYLPASSSVPTPSAMLGDIAGAPNFLPYAEDVHKYFRMLAAASPRVKVFTIGHSEEGREMIAVAIADEAVLAGLKDNDARLAKLADPRSIGMNDDTAAKLVAETTPVYYITGTIHSTESGAPTALMELGYRLTVDESPYIREIRSKVITLITPVVEVDGRDRMVDIYRWHRTHPEANQPPLIYWGHYVAHDNNRDAMTLTLNLTRNVLDTYVGWHAQVLHDLHESVPFLYDNTVGDGPYNAWIDPILTNEWQALGWDNVQEMTKFGMPGVFTHGDFDTWSPGYLMFIAAMHNGISRLYETFGNDGADTRERILTPEAYGRTWYRPNPPLPKVLWSQRDNNNYEQTGLLTALHYFSQNSRQFLQNFYLKGKRSIEKPIAAGPTAYVLPADDAHAAAQAKLLQILQAQHVEISRLDGTFAVEVPASKPESAASTAAPDKTPQKAAEKTPDTATEKPAEKPAPLKFPAGSYVVRMDQPYSRIADALLDHQYWSPDDPQKHPYDDTGWTLGELFDTRVHRLTDAAILQAPMTPVTTLIEPKAAISGSGPVALIDAASGVDWVAVAASSQSVSVAEKPFDFAGHHYAAGSLIVRKTDSKALESLRTSVALTATAPDVTTHPLARPRIALMHSWLDTQTEGWWRMALDRMGVKYDYISTQTAARDSDLRRHYDVILFGPVDVPQPRMIVDGLPMWGPKIPWRKTEQTPNLTIDGTDDIRPGLGEAGVSHLRQFVADGGLLVTAQSTARLAIELGLAPGVLVADGKDVKVTGSVLAAQLVDPTSPVAYGYGDRLSVYSADGLSFTISNLLTGDHGLPRADDDSRPTGRGGPHDPDTPEGRPPAAAAPLPTAKPWEALPLNADQMTNNPWLIPEDQRPRVILRFADADALLVSGLLDGGGAIAEHAAVVDARFGTGHVLLFAINPIWRGETIGSYALVFNTVFNFDRLGSPPTQPAEVTAKSNGSGSGP